MPAQVPAHIRAELGDKLRHYMEQAEMHAAELARQASQHGKRDIGRDLIGRYLSGKTFPGTANLAAIARALHIEPKDLLPPATSITGSTSARPGTMMRDLGNGRFYIEINREVPAALAARIALMLTESDGTERGNNRVIRTDP